MTKTIREALPFAYATYPKPTDGQEDACHGCRVYTGQVRVRLAEDGRLWLCRQCLERLRVTLKAAWKDLLPEKAKPRP